LFIVKEKIETKFGRKSVTRKDILEVEGEKNKQQ
jgi:hypothetical protein